MRHIAHDRWRRWPRSQWVHYCDPDCFVVTRMGKVDGVRRDGGVNVPCRGRKDCVQAAAPAMCGEIFRVGVWRMCQNRVQQGSGFEERVPVPSWLGRTPSHMVVEVAHKDAQVWQLCKPCVQLFTLVPRKWSVDVGDDVRCVARESELDGTGLAPHGGQLGDISGYGVVDEELRVRVLVPIGDGEVVIIHSSRPSCMVRSTTESKLL